MLNFYKEVNIINNFLEIETNVSPFILSSFSRKYFAVKRKYFVATRAKAKKFLRNNVFSARDDFLQMAKRGNLCDARIIKQ